MNQPSSMWSPRWKSALTGLLLAAALGCGDAAASRPAQPKAAGSGELPGPGVALPRAAGDAKLDAHERDELNEAIRLMHAGDPQRALAAVDKIIARYEAEHAGAKQHIYVGHSQAEMLFYMLSATQHGEQALALGPAW